MPKKRTLKPMIDELRGKKIFTDTELQILEDVKNSRNDFTHRLSDVYTSNINLNASKLELFQYFVHVRTKIAAATQLAELKMHDIAESKGHDVSGFLKVAKERVKEWL